MVGGSSVVLFPHGTLIRWHGEKTLKLQRQSVEDPAHHQPPCDSPSLRHACVREHIDGQVRKLQPH